MAAAVPDIAPKEIARVWEALGDCLHLAGRFEDAAHAFAAARELVPKGSRGAIELMRKEGLLREDMGRYEEAIRWYTAASRRPKLSRTKTRAGGSGSDSGSPMHRRATGRGHSRTASGTARTSSRSALKWATAASSPARISSSIWFTPSSAHRIGRLPWTRAAPLRRGRQSEGAGTALNNLGIDAYYEGDWEKAVDGMSGAKLFERIGDVTNVAMSTNNIGEILSDQGRLEEAKRCSRLSYTTPR